MCTPFLNSIDSTTHFWNIDNLETMRKWASILQHEEKVIHFMTALLVYISGFHQVLDFYPRQEEHVLDICKIKPSDDDIERRDQLGESVLQFCDRLQKNFPAETEEYLDYLANPSAEQDDTNTAVKCPTIKTETLPSKRLTDCSFIGNLPESCNVKTSKHYHRVSQLYSNVSS